MSLYESGDSSGEVSLKELFDGTLKLDGKSVLSIDRLAFLTCRDGWPRTLSMRDEIALYEARDCLDAVVKRGINLAGGMSKSPIKVRKLMRSLARNQGSQAPNTLIAEDVRDGAGISINEETVARYIKLLSDIFVVEDMPAWNPNLRSKTIIRSSSTRYYVDPSIAAAALGIGPNDLLNDLHTFGFLFETLCVRDLRVYAEALDGELFHYRDKDGLECDAVIHLRNGKYGLIEIKLGEDSFIEEGAENLKSLKEKIDAKEMNVPSFLMVLVGNGEYPYIREDEVYVVPIGCLKN